MITEDEPSYHARALYRRLSRRTHRILYVGLDHALLRSLEKRLEDCWIVRAPAGCVARHFIERLKHSLLVFDEVLMDTTARELARFTREVAHREQTPVIIVKKSGGVRLLAQIISNRLAE
ncbi:MAG TPA: hypothetical protein VF658_15920 [Pyrinomonadaceae bacterium]